MKKQTTHLILILAVVLAVTVSSVTFAWLVKSNTVIFPTEFGSAQAAYFGGGTGTAADPYLISDPIHLYNLAWLQYLGYFNMRPDFNNGLPQSHFKLTENIDMSKAKTALPPIGTAEYPFIGKFDGNGKIISNLTVSNSKEDFKQYPTKAVFSDNILHNAVSDGDISIVGLFGVVGNYNGYIANQYSQYTVDTKIMSVSDFYADTLTVKSTTSQTLVGLIAGYVGCDVKNTGVYQCKFDIARNAVGLTGYDFTVSKYSIVGDYDNNTVSWKELDAIGGTPGTEATWGGSIDMRTLNRRLTYMVAKVGVTETIGTTKAEDANWGINISRNSNAEFYWNVNDNSYQYLYLNEGTILPLNVDKTAMGLDVATEIEVDKAGGNGKFHINEYYQTNDQEKVGDKNTGYIVSKGSGSGSYIRPRIQPLASSNDGGIYKSLGYSITQSGISYDETHQKKMEMLTISFDGQGGYYTYRIKDHVNAENTGTAFPNVTQKTYFDLGFTGYKNVRDEFDKTMENAYMVHGFHFYNKLSAANATAYTTVKKTVQLYKTDRLETLNNYPLIEGGINFTVSDAGSIKAVLGTFYGGSGSAGNSMFDLYKVVREEAATGGYLIKSFTRISKIYKDSNGTIVYNPDNTEGLTLVFDFDAVTKSDILQKNAAYYFEIPVTAGDYVIGSDAGSSASNAYLMYLDIGANGSDEGTSTTHAYSISCLDFVSPEEGKELTVPTSKDGNGNFMPAYADVVFEIKNANTVQIWFKRESWSGVADPINTEVLWWLDGPATVTPTPTEGMSSPSESAKWSAVTENTG